MKILCADCFSPVGETHNGKAKCSSCGKEYDMERKRSIFRARIDGGYIKDGMTEEEIIKLIESGNILPDEYVAPYDGPWVTVYESPFSSYIPAKIRKKKARTAVGFYRKKRAAFFTSVILFLLFLISLGANIFLLYLMWEMRVHIEELVSKVSGG